jgi:hypothetical protein
MKFFKRISGNLLAEVERTSGAAALGSSDGREHGPDSGGFMGLKYRRTVDELEKVNSCKTLVYKPKRRNHLEELDVVGKTTAV